MRSGFTNQARGPAARSRAWIDDEAEFADRLRSVGMNRFLLIAGEEGQAWCDAANKAAGATGVAVDTVRIGHIDGDLFDPRLAWIALAAYRPRAPCSSVRTNSSDGVRWVRRPSRRRADLGAAADFRALGVVSRPRGSRLSRGERRFYLILSTGCGATAA